MIDDNGLRGSELTESLPCSVCGRTSEISTMVDSQIFGYVAGRNCEKDCYDIARGRAATARRASAYRPRHF